MQSRYGKIKVRKLILAIVSDILLTGILLSVFAMFHHVIPLTLKKIEIAEKISSAPSYAAPVTKPVTDEITEGGSDAGAEDTQPPRSWKEKFSDRFTEEIVTDAYSYSSPEISINVTKNEFGDGNRSLVYFVADIYIGDIECFSTAVPKEESTELINFITMENSSILAINGDYFISQPQGFFVRNGVVFDETKTDADMCVLYYDGVMETYSSEEYEVDDVLSRGAYQVWQFGPKLLDSYGQPLDKFNTSVTIGDIKHPRSALGYFEPGHYCFVVVDGRQSGYSDGVTIPKLAEIMSELGCKSAYNMDGGASSAMVMYNTTVNRQSSNDRTISDILFIRERGNNDEED